MEKTIKKLFVAGSLLVGAAVSFMSLTTYAVDASGTAAANGVSTSTTFSLTVNGVLTLKNVSGGSTITASPTSIVETGSISATVVSNSKYTLSLSATKPALTLANGAATTADKQISAGTPTAGTNAWGVKKNGATTYTALTTANQTFFTSTASAPTEAGTTTSFGIGVSVAPSLPAGDYSTTVTVTAAAQ